MRNLVRLRNWAGATILLLGCALHPAGVTAHVTDEDAADAKQAAITGLAPRVTARSDLFELVGIANGATLTLYLDNFAKNDPVKDASIEIDANGAQLKAEADGDGTYRIAADWIARPGLYPLVFTIMTADQSDLLAGELNVPAPPADVATAPGFPLVGRTFGLPLFAAFLLGVFAALVARRAATGAARLVAARAVFALAWRPGVADRGSDERIWRGLLASLGRLAARVGSVVRAMHLARLPRAVSVALTSTGIVAIVIVIVLLFETGVFAGSSTDAPAPAAAPPAAAPAPVAAVAIAAPATPPHRLLDGSVFVPKPSQRLLDLRTAVTEVAEVASTVRVAGEVIPDPGTSGQVHSTIKGRLEAANGVWPRVGQKVKAGEVLAWVVPVINPIDRGIIYQQIAQLDQALRLAQQHLKEVTANGSQASAQDVDNARSDIDSLSRRRAGMAVVLHDRDSLRAPLVAPADGVIASSDAVAGQMVDEQDKLFEVVDPMRLWVAAYAYDIATLGDIRDADAVSSTGHSYKLAFESRGPRLQRQTIPLYFKLEKPDQFLSVGSLVTVFVNTDGNRRGIILPRNAVVRDSDGQSVVWQHAGAENFVPLPIRYEPIDGKQVLVTAGLKAATRVVRSSADLLAEVR